MATSLYDDIVPLVQHLDVKWANGGRIWIFCPCHPDGQKHGRRSLSLDPTYGLKCFAGCDWQEVLVKLKEGAGVDIRPTTQGPKSLYKYKDAEGNVIAEKGRWELGDGTKEFKWRLPGSVEWSGLKPYSLTDIPLYNCEFLKERPGPIYFVEGEKAADACTIGLNLLALTFGGGASTKDFGKSLRVLEGRQVILWPDNDDQGRAYMRRVAQALDGIATEVLMVQPEGQPPKGDAFDYFRGGGKTEDLIPEPLEQLTALREMEPVEAYGETSTWQRSIAGYSIQFEMNDLREERTGPHAQVSIFCDGSMLAHTVMNLWRDDERVRLINSAYGHFQRDGVVADAYPKNSMKHDFDLFCLAAVKHLEDRWMAEEMEGTEDVTPPAFYLHPYVIQGGGTVMFAPPGSGKSWLLMLMAVSIDAGTDAVFAVQQSKVLLVNLERSRSSVARRLAIINDLLKLPRNRPILTINSKGKGLAKVASAVRRSVLEHGVQVVFLDSISRAGVGSMVADDVANSIIDTLNNIAPTWIAIGHTPRGDSTHQYGSIFFDAGQDIGVRIVSEQKDNGLRLGLEVVKANEMKAGHRDLLELVFDEDSVVTEVKRISLQLGNHLFSEKKGTRLEKVLAFFESLSDPKATSVEVSAATGVDITNVGKILANSEFFIKVEKIGRDQYYGLMDVSHD